MTEFLNRINSRSNIVSLMKNPRQESSVKGHGFSRANRVNPINGLQPLAFSLVYLKSTLSTVWRGYNVATRRSSQSLLFSILAACAIFLISQSASAQPTPLHIAAAADLQPVLPPILDQFHQATGIEVKAAYQASAALTTLIQNGAPFDLFLSADLGFPKRLIDAGKADTAGSPDSSSPIPYARGTLVLWTRKDSHWPNPSLTTLSDPDLKRLAIANPDRAPYGRAAIAALTSLKLIDALKPKFVTAENIAQAAQFAETGNADAGLISLTSASTPHLKEIGNYFIIPANLYPSIEQGAVIITATTQRENAHKFLDFLLSPAIQQQLAKSGLTPVR